MLTTALSDLWYGFGVALEPHNLMFCFLGVLIGNMVGVLPGMGPLATISILLPLTFGIKPVGAILMLAGVFYGAQYGGAICSILLNLTCHPPHAVTCLDGFPMTKQGRGGVWRRFQSVSRSAIRPRGHRAALSRRSVNGVRSRAGSRASRVSPSAKSSMWNTTSPVRPRNGSGKRS